MMHWLRRSVSFPSSGVGFSSAVGAYTSLSAPALLHGLSYRHSIVFPVTPSTTLNPARGGALLSVSLVSQIPQSVTVSIMFSLIR